MAFGASEAAAVSVPEPGTKPAQACRAGFGFGAFGGYLPTGSATAGGEVSVEVLWETGRLAGSRAKEVIACVGIGAALVDDLATSLGEVDNDGRHTHVFVVPKDSVTGGKVCQRSLVLGDTLTGAPTAVRSAPVCLTVTASSAAPDPVVPASVTNAPEAHLETQVVHADAPEGAPGRLPPYRFSGSHLDRGRWAPVSRRRTGAHG